MNEEEEMNEEDARIAFRSSVKLSLKLLCRAPVISSNPRSHYPNESHPLVVVYLVL